MEERSLGDIEIPSLEGSLLSRGSSAPGQRTPIQHLSGKIRKDIAVQLEVGSSVVPMNCWEGVAKQLRIPTMTICHIAEQSIGKPTLRLFEVCEEQCISVEEFMEAVRVANNQPALDILECSYPKILDENNRRLESIGMEAQKSCKVILQKPRQYPAEPERIGRVELTPREPQYSNLDRERNSEPIRRGMCRINLRESQQQYPEQNERRHTWAQTSSYQPRGDCSDDPACNSGSPCTSTGSGAQAVRANTSRVGSSKQKTSRLSEPKQAALPHTMSAAPNIQRATFREGTRHVQVLLTYSCHGKRQMKVVFNVAECLKKNGFSVSHEESESHQLAQDKLGWLDAKFRNVDFILVLITPEYARDVSTVTTDKLLIDPTDRALNTRYIYKLMLCDYVLNGCLNKRFIPILMPDYGESCSGEGSTAETKPCDRELIPTWLQHTIVYSWPGHYRDLLFHMINADKLLRNYISSRQRNVGQNICLTRS